MFFNPENILEQLSFKNSKSRQGGEGEEMKKNFIIILLVLFCTVACAVKAPEERNVASKQYEATVLGGPQIGGRYVNCSFVAYPVYVPEKGTFSLIKARKELKQGDRVVITIDRDDNFGDVAVFVSKK